MLKLAFIWNQALLLHFSCHLLKMIAFLTGYQDQSKLPLICNFSLLKFLTFLYCHSTQSICFYQQSQLLMVLQCYNLLQLLVYTIHKLWAYFHLIGILMILQCIWLISQTVTVTLRKEYHFLLIFQELQSFLFRVFILYLLQKRLS